MKKLLALPVILAASLATQPVKATPWLNIDGTVNFDSNASSLNDYTSKLRVQDAETKFELILREGIKAVIKAELESKLNGGKVFDDYEWGLILEEAYIQIQTDKLTNLPKAIVTLGKHKMAFGQNISDLPMPKDRLLFKLAKENEVIGMTVELPHNFFNIVDSVAVSVFEAGANDMEIADEKGLSIKVSKKMSEQIQAQISYLIKEKAANSDKEQRGSVGFVFKCPDGSMKIWAEGLVIRENATYGDTWGAVIGASKKVGPGTIVLEYDYLNDQAHEVSAAYNLPVGQALVISPEVRHRMDLTDTKDDETVVGIRARLQVHFDNERGLLTGKQ